MTYSDPNLYCKLWTVKLLFLCHVDQNSGICSPSLFCPMSVSHIHVAITAVLWGFINVIETRTALLRRFHTQQHHRWRKADDCLSQFIVQKSYSALIPASSFHQAVQNTSTSNTIKYIRQSAWPLQLHHEGLSADDCLWRLITLTSYAALIAARCFHQAKQKNSRYQKPIYFDRQLGKTDDCLWRLITLTSYAALIAARCFHQAKQKNSRYQKPISTANTIRDGRQSSSPIRCHYHGWSPDAKFHRNVRRLCWRSVRHRVSEPADHMRWKWSAPSLPEAWQREKSQTMAAAISNHDNGMSHGLCSSAHHEYLSVAPAWLLRSA